LYVAKKPAPGYGYEQR